MQYYGQQRVKTKHWTTTVNFTRNECHIGHLTHELCDVYDIRQKKAVKWQVPASPLAVCLCDHLCTVFEHLFEQVQNENRKSYKCDAVAAAAEFNTLTISIFLSLVLFVFSSISHRLVIATHACIVHCVASCCHCRSCVQMQKRKIKK